MQKDRFSKHSESFMREAAVLAKLNHPNIIRMYGVIVEPIITSPSSAAAMSRMSSGSSSKDGGGDFGARPPHSSTQLPQTALIAGIMTDFVRGGSLKDQLRHATRCLTLKERCQVAVQAARGMAYLHAQNPAVIHFDLKPDNLLVDGDGDTLHVKVADFVSHLHMKRRTLVEYSPSSFSLSLSGAIEAQVLLICLMQGTQGYLALHGECELL